VKSTLLIALAAMLWGVDLLLRPAALSAGWSPAAVVLGEHLLLTAAFAVTLWRGRGMLAALTRRQWAALLCVSWGGSALATWLYTLGFSLDPSHALNVVLLQKTQPLFALLLAGLVLGERRGPQFWAWGALAVIGATLLVVYDPGGTYPYASLSHYHGIVPTRFVWPSPTDLHAKQALCALGASALWGAATVAGRPLARTLTPSLLAGARFALAVPVLALLTLAPVQQAHAPTHGVPFALGFLALIVLLPDLAGMGLYYGGLRGTTASVATLAELCYPLTSLILGLTVLGAPVGWGQLAGLAGLIIAVLMLARAPRAVVTPDSAFAAHVAIP
jgi:drug/metabolite transporter (DMT)-like permease